MLKLSCSSRSSPKAVSRSQWNDFPRSHRAIVYSLALRSQRAIAYSLALRIHIAIAYTLALRNHRARAYSLAFRSHRLKPYNVFDIDASGMLSIKYVMLFWTNLYSLPPVTSSQILAPPLSHAFKLKNYQ